MHFLKSFFGALRAGSLRIMEDAGVFILGALSLALFRATLQHIDLANGQRDALELLHFRSVYALELVLASSAILRLIEGVVRKPV